MHCEGLPNFIFIEFFISCEKDYAQLINKFFEFLNFLMTPFGWS